MSQPDSPQNQKHVLRPSTDENQSTPPSSAPINRPSASSSYRTPSPPPSISPKLDTFSLAEIPQRHCDDYRKLGGSSSTPILDPTNEILSLSPDAHSSSSAQAQEALETALEKAGYHSSRDSTAKRAFPTRNPCFVRLARYQDIELQDEER